MVYVTKSASQSGATSPGLKPHTSPEDWPGQTGPPPIAIALFWASCPDTKKETLFP